MCSGLLLLKNPYVNCSLCGLHKGNNFSRVRQTLPHSSKVTFNITKTNQKNQMRRRFKQCRICSSESYILSRQIHRRYIREWHANHSEEIRIISERIVVKQRYYVMCFGNLVEITETEAIRMQSCMTIIRK